MKSLEEGKLIWITGLSGAGKTTLGKKIYEELKEKYDNIVFLDGDRLREILGGNYSHDINGRIETAKIYSKLCNYFTSQGINVIISTISLFNEVQEMNKKNNMKYYEIFLKVDEDNLKKRKKEIYEKKMNVMGVDQTPEFPKNPSIVLKNNNLEDIINNVNKIMKLIGEQDE